VWIVVWNTHDGDGPLKKHLCRCDEQADAERIVKGLQALDDAVALSLHLSGFMANYSQ
jgi:hypothetical protein